MTDKDITTDRDIIGLVNNIIDCYYCEEMQYEVSHTFNDYIERLRKKMKEKGFCHD